MKHRSIASQDLRSSAAVHGSMLHELKEIYKHLRVELKDVLDKHIKNVFPRFWGMDIDIFFVEFFP